MHVSIIGYGNQAKAWALNLKDSGVEVSIILREKSSSIALASKEFSVYPLNSVPRNSVIALLAPDETHEEILNILDSYLESATIIYAHGHSLSSGSLEKKFPRFNHLLLAPKGIARAIRSHYQKKIPLAAAYSVEYSKDTDFDLKFLKHLAHKLGIENLYQCTFEQETTADLFSEQSLLCSVLPYAANLSFNKLCEQGVPKELAYLECWYEVKLIADAMVEMGPDKFFSLISPNALYGSQLGKRQLIGKEFENALSTLLENIQSGKFNKEVSKVNMKSVRDEVNKYWATQQLSKVHKQLAPNLFPEDN